MIIKMMMMIVIVAMMLVVMIEDDDNIILMIMVMWSMTNFICTYNRNHCIVVVILKTLMTMVLLEIKMIRVVEKNNGIGVNTLIDVDGGNCNGDEWFLKMALA